MKDQIVLITGGAYGLGAAAVKAFQQAGAKVATLDVFDAPTADLSIRGDVTQRADWERAIRELKEWGGEWNTLIELAAMQPHRNRPNESTRGLIEDFVGTQAKAMIYGGQLANNHMAPFGSIVTASAFSILNEEVDVESFEASEKLVHELTESRSRDLLSKGIRVNGILPRLFSQSEAPADQISIRELTSALLFLVSEGSEHTLGTILPTDRQLLASWLEADSSSSTEAA